VTVWRALEAVAIGAAIVIGGSAAGLGAMWLLARAARKWGTDDTPMGHLVAKDGLKEVLAPEDADAMRARAEARRDRAEAKHAEGHQIETGQPDRQIKLVGRR
jgi:NAD(P)H-hydrate repair Nnr-like enzyme with NAD(P)H-hydrate dehydratase domain